jgi:mRNA interferase RelE/StbE
MPEPYEVEFTEEALNNLRRYPQNDQRRILARINQLALNPFTMSNVKRLVDFAPAYRLRVGNYRVFFDRDDTIRIIDVVDILPRGRAYRR